MSLAEGKPSRSRRAITAVTLFTSVAFVAAFLFASALSALFFNDLLETVRVGTISGVIAAACVFLIAGFIAAVWYYDV